MFAAQVAVPVAPDALAVDVSAPISPDVRIRRDEWVASQALCFQRVCEADASRRPTPGRPGCGGHGLPAPRLWISDWCDSRCHAQAAPGLTTGVRHGAPDFVGRPHRYV